MSEIYSSLTLDHFRNPRNVGALDAPSAFGHAENPVSGASLDLYLMLDSDGVIGKVVFKAQGCTATIAAASVSTELLPGRRLDTEPVVSRNELADALGQLPPARRHAYRLVEDAIHAAVENYSRSAAAIA